MEIRYKTKTQSLLYGRPLSYVVEKAKEYTEKYKVNIQIENISPKNSQIADAKSITELMFMQLVPGSDLEVIVKGDSEKELNYIAENMAKVLSAKYDA
jgi:phosphotransferase system HPr-like phosphotransfer protein